MEAKVPQGLSPGPGFMQLDQGLSWESFLEKGECSPSRVREERVRERLSQEQLGVRPSSDPASPALGGLSRK